MSNWIKLCACLAASALVAVQAAAAELLLPQERNAYYATEPIEIAVVGTAAGKASAIQLAPKTEGRTPVELSANGDGGTVTLVIPANALAPGQYALKLDGADTGQVITVSSGVNNSTMFVSQSSTRAPEGGANFILGNAFSFGRLGPDGLPTTEPRGKRSMGFNAFEHAVEANLPTVCYMYWTGYVTHKAFGSHKDWAEEHMVEATRLLNFHTAQQLRRYGPNVSMIGTLDEPGLAWGKTPAGGEASGFPGWDEAPWYESRGWKFTNDIAAGSDADWIKYMTIRCAIMGEVNGFAKQDIKAVWPSAVFATDLYAPHAIMDGTDPWNQRVNEVPVSHVFVDWGVGKLGALSGLILEKSDDPTRKIAHAMNGQLMGERVPQPGHSNAYRIMMNAMLAADIKSNWWLNTGGMSTEDLAAVNEPAARVGPVFAEMSTADHDVAVLWSFTECAMRQKQIAAMESRKKTGEQIALMIASAPEDARDKEGKVNVSAYSVGQDYKDCILQGHQAIARAGYPAHILHEKALPAQLKRYKTLVVIGQTFELPADIKKTIADWQAAGGKVVVDKTTTVKFDNAIVTNADLKEIGFKWQNVYGLAEKAMGQGAALGMFKSVKDASLRHTNFFMDEPARAAAPLIKKSLQQTASKPAIESDDVHLAAEKHTGGEGALVMVINAFEQLPETPDDHRYFIWNYAAHQGTFKLAPGSIAPGSAVYCIEGTDWKKVSKVEHPDQPINGSFEAGEMKLYLVAPKNPSGLDAKGEVKGGVLEVTASLKDVKMPWPLTVSVKGPAGEVYYVWRSTNATGTYTESFPVGSNLAAGDYTVSIESPVGDLKASATAKVGNAAVAGATVADAARVFDGDAIKALLASKPEIVIAIANDSPGTVKPIADKLAGELTAKGAKVSVKPESEVIHKVKYPRVWNPSATLVKATGEEKPLPADAKADVQATVATDANGVVTIKGADGKELKEWNTPNSVATIGGEGFVNFDNVDVETVYEPGVKIYFNKDGAPTVLKGTADEVKTDDAFRAKWARPWTRLTMYVGGYQLPPQLPEAYGTASHLILLGDSKTSPAVAALQASDLLLQVADEKYPGPGKALVSFAWSPFAVERNVILIAASDAKGLEAGAAKLLELAKQ